MLLSLTRDLIFSRNLLEKIYKLFKNLQNTRKDSRVSWELALKYSQERVAFGKPIFNHQAIAPLPRDSFRVVMKKN